MNGAREPRARRSADAHESSPERLLTREKERNDRTSGGEVGWIERMVPCWIDKALHHIFFAAHLTHEPGIT
jgi:hypothetical protein